MSEGRGGEWAQPVFWHWEQRGGVALSTVGLSGLIWIRVSSPVCSQDSNNHIILYWADASGSGGNKRCLVAAMLPTCLCKKLNCSCRENLQGSADDFAQRICDNRSKVEWIFVACGRRTVRIPVCSPLQHPERSLQPALGIDISALKPGTLISQEQLSTHARCRWVLRFSGASIRAFIFKCKTWEIFYRCGQRELRLTMRCIWGSLKFKETKKG